MKLLPLFAILTFASHAFATQVVNFRCEVDNRVLNIKYSQGHATYNVSEADGSMLTEGSFTSSQVGTDDFLKTLVFGFESTDSVVALALLDVKTIDDLQPGTYAAKSDLIVQWGNDYISGSTISCQAKVRNELRFDCNNLGDAQEARICESAVSESCEDVAKTAVKMHQELVTNKSVEILSVREIQEDATYEVGYVFQGQVEEIMYLSRVLVSTDPKQCRLYGIE